MAAETAEEAAGEEGGAEAESPGVQLLDQGAEDIPAAGQEWWDGDN